MRDYDELIERLRYCADRPICFSTQCDYRQTAHIGACFDSLKHDAADAIEELLAKVPKWISVEDALPSRYETVLLNIQTCKDSYVTIGDYEPNELRFRDFADRNNQVYCGDIVTHWMPLPTPPKGVE